MSPTSSPLRWSLFYDGDTPKSCHVIEHNVSEDDGVGVSNSWREDCFCAGTSVIRMLSLLVINSEHHCARSA